MARKPKSPATPVEVTNQPEVDTVTTGGDTNSRAITIEGLKFTIDNPYSEGHVCTAIEANVLNQTRSQNLRNNFAPSVKKAIEEAQKTGEPVDMGPLTDKFTAYMAEYAFAERARGAGPIDPVEREALNIAKTLVRAAAAAKNFKLEDKVVTELAVKHLSGPKGAEIKAEAQRRVDEKQRLASQALSLEDLGIDTSGGAAAEEQPAEAAE